MKLERDINRWTYRLDPDGREHFELECYGEPAPPLSRSDRGELRRKHWSRHFTETLERCGAETWGEAFRPLVLRVVAACCVGLAAFLLTHC